MHGEFSLFVGTEAVCMVNLVLLVIQESISFIDC